MKVTVCSNCGTKNPAGSKFCNNCGQSLIPDTRQICPNCETPNPNHLLYCDNCGTRLADEHLPAEENDESPESSSPANRSQPFSLPSRPAGETANLEVSGEIPEWLKTGEGAETQGEETESHLPEWARAAQESGAEWEDEEAPTLDDVSGDHRPSDDLPVWLMDEDLPDTIFTKDKSTDELFEALGTEAEAGKKRESIEDLPDWLQGLASGTGPLPTLAPESDSAETEEEEDEWSNELDRNEDTTPVYPSPDETFASLEDWLKDVETEGSAEGHSNLESTFPSTSEERLTGEPAAEEARPEETVPGWLANLGDGPAEREPTVPDAVEDAEAEEIVPDWLADLEAEPADSEADTYGAAETLEPEETVPDWLANLQTSASGVEEPEEPSPGWVAGPDITKDDASVSEAPSQEPEETVPEWLAKWAAGAAETAAAEDEKLPSDLDSDEEAEPTAPESTFDWLADLEAEAAAAPEIAPEEFESQEVLDFELSDAAAEEEPAEEPAERSAEAEVPDWLAALDAESFAEDADLVAEPEPTEEDFPDWLSGLNVEVAESSPEDDIGAFADEERLPDWLREADEAEAVSDTTAEAKDVPPWLQEAEAELPDWLMETEAAASLRSSVEDEEEPGEAEAKREQGEQSVEELSEQPAEPPSELAVEEPGQPAEEELPELLEEAAQPAEEEVVEEQEDWLSELGILESDEPEEPFGGITPSAEMPEWLREMAPPQTGSLVPPEEVRSVSEDLDNFLGDPDSEELPEWLLEDEAELVDESLADELAPDELDEADKEALTDWSSAELAEDELSFSGAEETTAAQPATQGQPEETVGAELTQEEEPEEIMETFVPSDDLPDWLGDVMFDIDESEAFAFEEEEEAEAPLPPSAEVEGVPDTLAGDELPGWLEDSFPETAEGEIPVEPTPLDELPEWLRPPGKLEGVSLIEDDKWGDLLGELPPPAETDQDLSEAEIPEWLRALQPREFFEEEEAKEARPEQVPESGPLAGLPGVIAIEPVIAEAPSARRVGDYMVSKEQQQQAALLQQLTRTVSQEAVQMGPTKSRERFPLLQLLLALLLLVAMVSGFFLPTLVEPELPAAAGLAEARSLVAEAAPLPVLVAFDYTPAMAGALDAQALLLLEEIADTGSPVLITSQSAAGLTLAEQKVAEISALESQRIGYIPGGALGLRRLASCLEESTTCESLYGQPLNVEVGQSLAESGLIVVLAGDQESVINWIEQVAVPTDKPLLAIVPQAVAPVVAPYYASAQLAGLLSSSPAAIATEWGVDEPLAADSEGQVTALALAQWLTVGLLVVGNLFYLFTGPLRGRREGTA